jgi:hypothetical protein
MHAKVNLTSNPQPENQNLILTTIQQPACTATIFLWWMEFQCGTSYLFENGYSHPKKRMAHPLKRTLCARIKKHYRLATQIINTQSLTTFILISSYPHRNSSRSGLIVSSSPTRTTSHRPEHLNLVLGLLLLLPVASNIVINILSHQIYPGQLVNSPPWLLYQ